MDSLNEMIRVTEAGCHEWQGSLFTNGYGQMKVGGIRRPFHAHRVVWTLARGPIPNGLLVLHRCDNRSCVNIDHLFLGTHKDNMADMAAKGRARSGRTPESYPHGEAHPRVRLSNIEVVNMRSDYNAGGVTQTELSVRYGVSQSLVSKIVRGLHR